MTGLRAILKTLVLIVAVFLLSACGGGGGGGDLPDGQAGGHGSPPTQPDALAHPYFAKQIGTIPERITDICRWGDAIFLSPYLGYGKGKVYVYDGSLYAESIGVGRIESVYRVWVGKDGQVHAGTEQPALFLTRPWQVVQKYASHGWAVLGNMASDGSEWRGYSYRGQPSRMWRDNEPFPSIPGRIVWCVESFRGFYYAGTSGNSTYKNANDGLIYIYDSSWQVVPLGLIGGVITAKTHKDAIYFGTTHPESILRFDGERWDRWDYDFDLEVAKFWVDEAGRLFTATANVDTICLRQFCHGSWEVVWSIPGHSTRWGPQGTAWDGKIILAFWDRNMTKVWEIDYR